MSPPRPQRILVVDDNETMRKLLAFALEAEGYVAIAAECGEAALEVARFDPPDLAVIDQYMPGMTGADLVRALRACDDERLRRVPVIGLSGMEGGGRLLVEAGALAALPKPFEERPLLDLVRRALGAGGSP